jgi:hypothetical protein
MSSIKEPPLLFGLGGPLSSLDVRSFSTSSTSPASVKPGWTIRDENVTKNTKMTILERKNFFLNNQEQTLDQEFKKIRN